MSRPGSLAWFGRHEARLAWREAVSLLSGGRPGRSRAVFIGFVVVAVVMHGVAVALVSGFEEIGTEADRSTLTLITAIAIVSWSLMLSQAMEAVTRAFYSRADFDLILSSPAPSQLLFSIRIVAVAFSTMTMALVMAGPFINVLAYRGGLQWLGGYGLLAAMGFSASAFGVVFCATLFRLIGPRRTRFVSQILAAIVGAGFVIGLQLAAIMSFGRPSGTSFLESEEVTSRLPDVDSPFWLPARAALGDLHAFGWVLATSIVILGAVILLFARSFGDHALAAAGVSEPKRRAGRAARFRSGSLRQVLRRKEWMLLRRDPWLASQTLMQLLYLLPPAFLLWRNLGSNTSSMAVVGPVLVMAAGQFAGGLAWLAVSGEDAPELIATAPATPAMVVRAKIEAVIACVAVVFGPLALAMMPASLSDGLIVLAGIVISAASATLIQLWFRRQAKRSQFRRRQTSSRLATIAEAFTTIGWAGATGLFAAGSWLAVPAGGFAGLVLLGVWLLSPRGKDPSSKPAGAAEQRDPAYPAPA